MKYEFTLEVTVADAFAADIDCSADINVSGRAWTVDDISFWGCREGKWSWIALDRQNAFAIEIERQARERLGAPAIKLEIDNRVGWDLLEAGVVPLPEYEHLTKHDYGLRT